MRCKRGRAQLTENIDQYRAQVRLIPCRFCHSGPRELCVKPDPHYGQPECGEQFLPRAHEGWTKRCTVRGPHTTHAHLPPHRVQTVAYVHDERSMDHLAMLRHGYLAMRRG